MTGDKADRHNTLFVFYQGIGIPGQTQGIAGQSPILGQTACLAPWRKLVGYTP